MYKKQLGRRNLTEEQKAYMVGKMYEARKKSVGAQEGNSNAEKQNGQNVHIVSRREQRNGTPGEIGKEIGIDGRTVRRAEKFAKGIDAIREQNPEAADKVLRGGSEKKICGLWAICLPFLFTFARNEKMTEAKMFKKHKKRD